MPEETYKRRFNRAVDTVKQILKEYCENSAQLKNEVFHFECFKSKKESYLIRIVLNEVSELDKKLVEDFSIPDTIVKEIWIKKEDKGGFYRINFTREKWIKSFPPYIETEKRSYKTKEVRNVVYFILNLQKNAVKIGRSIKASRRLSELKSQHFDELRLLKTIESDNAILLERKLHDKFKKYHIKGEWFNYSDEIKEYIKCQK